MRRILLLATLLLCCLAPHAWAQQKKAVSGSVKDATGTPLPGVTILEKGTSNGTVTTADGSFKISVEPSATLLFTFMGYAQQEVPASASSFNIVLKDDQRSLNEVVVTAMGFKREQRKLGYAVTELKGAEIAKTNSINPVAALQGKVAGVDISGAAGGPQAASRIVLRGAKSLNGKDQPIFVIDGTIFENDASDNAVNFGNVLKNFNPDDFETVTVLKGAAATALYGSRAINGAVLITTKKGTSRKGIGVDVSQTVQMESVYRTPIALQNKYGAGQNPYFRQEAGGVQAIDWVGGYSYGPEMLGQNVKLPNGEFAPFSAQPNNWKNSYQTGKYYNTNVAVEGGNENANFRASYSHLDNNSVMPNNGFKRDVFSLKSSAIVSKYLSVEGGASYATSTSLNPTRQGGDYTNENVGRKFIYVFPRNYNVDFWKSRYKVPTQNGRDLLDALGEYPGIDYWWTLNEDSWKRKESLFMGNLAFNITATDWMKFVLRGNFSNEQLSDDRRQLGWGPNFGGSRGMFATAGQNKTQYTLTGIAMISPKIRNKDWTANVNVGAEMWNSGIGNKWDMNTRDGLRTPGLYDMKNSVGTVNSNYYALGRKRINSLFAAASVSYKNAYFLDVTARNDWSSALTYPNGSGDNSYLYPSVSAAWEFTETFKQSMPSWVTYGKLRASYAYVGGDLDPFLNNTGYVTGSIWNGAGQANLPINNIFQPDLLPNQNLKPSMAGNFEFGADVRFLNNRLGLDVAVYQADIKDQIIQLDVPYESGVKRKIINAGHFRNRGIEVAINARPIEGKNFGWDLTLNGSRNINTIIKLDPAISTYELSSDQDVRAIAQVGKAYGELVTDYAYVRDPKTGLPVINNGGTSFKRGFASVGNITPDFNLGLNNNFTYKNWSLGFLIQARIGGDIFSASHQYGTGRGTLESTLPGRDAASGGLAWTDAEGRQRNDGMIPDGVFENGTKRTVNGNEVDLSGMTYRDAYNKGYVTAMSPFNYYSMIGDWGIGIREASVFDATYVALREVSVGYNMPSSITSKLKLSKLRVMLVGRNLGYLFNNLPDNINPEGIRNNATSAFSEYGGTPFVRNMAFTVQVGF
ncbi:SusC/RagA family TonB-linked outer membrane protein [Chitinophaga caseinilytica]|uniref:SusC/RagA family TonB-linked outer membrane protein n=1 Tax=Chitinophaga caseinilytica TaxID=2267521 RepID=UPI003C2DD2EE